MSEEKKFQRKPIEKETTLTYKKMRKRNIEVRNEEGLLRGCSGRKKKEGARRKR